MPTLLQDKAAAAGGPLLAMGRLEANLVLPLAPAQALELMSTITGQPSASHSHSFPADRVTQAAVMAAALAIAPQVTGGWHDQAAGMKQAVFLVDWTCRCVWLLSCTCLCIRHKTVSTLNMHFSSMHSAS